MTFNDNESAYRERLKEVVDYCNQKLDAAYQLPRISVNALAGSKKALHRVETQTEWDLRNLRSREIIERFRDIAMHELNATERAKRTRAA